MNFKEFERKAKCLYCERPINMKMARRSRQAKNSYRCECTLSRRIKLKDGYNFFLPVSQKYEIFIDTKESILKVQMITCTNPEAPANQQLKTIKNILSVDEFPEFMSLPRLKLIDRLEEYLTFI